MPSHDEWRESTRNSSRDFLATRAICELSEKLQNLPSEDGVLMEVAEYLTQIPEVDDVILMYVRTYLAFRKTMP